jgi:EAL domain-containing protein (putative c-di-GMP-specific phosphodiesterase class I)
LRRADFVESFLGHTQSCSSSSCGLDVEITEGALLDESSTDVEKLNLLRTTGVKVAIDDFGTGHSSLSRLALLPVDTLKIDRSFVNAMSADPRGKRLVAIIVSIARAFQMTVVAEGVETEDQLHMLSRLGCDQSQGFLHSRPINREQFAELLRRNRGLAGLTPAATRGQVG